HESAIHHVILVEPELVVGGGVRGPTGAEFNPAPFRARTATHPDHDLERHDLTETERLTTERGQGVECAGAWAKSDCIPKRIRCPAGETSDVGARQAARR